MPEPLKILIAEDNPVDAELLVRQLRRDGFQFEWKRVETEHDYLAGLRQEVDLILSDYQMPEFSGLRALELLRKSELEIPFILVSGTIGEDIAVDAMREGASDYLLKDRLTRLGAAVSQAIAGARLRRERKEGEQLLRRAHAQLGQLLEHSPAVLYALKLEGGKVIPYRVSENIVNLLGYSAPEVMSYDWWYGHLHPDDRDRAVKILSETISAGATHMEYRIRHKDGEYRWIDDTQRLVRNSKGQPGELVGVWTDITERKRAEELMRQASGNLVEGRKKGVRIEVAVFVGVCILSFFLEEHFNWRGRITRWFLRRYPDDVDEMVSSMLLIIVGLAVFGFRRWREAESELTSTRQMRTGLGLLHDELDRRVKRRTEELDAANKTLHNDIAERERTELALAESEARFREVAETIQEVFWVTNAEKTRMLYISPAYEKIWGRSCQSLYDSPGTWVDSLHPDDRARVLQATTTKQPDGTYDEEYRIVRPDGSERWIHDRAFPVRDSAGVLQRVVGVGEDITESKKLHEQFLRAQRMEAIGTLAGGVAHDLNNILAPMLMVPALLRDSLPKASDQHLIDMIDKAARRGASVVRQLLTFSRGTSGERAAVQLRHLFKEMGEIMHETFPRDIAIDYFTPADLSPVVGDPTQLHQVLLNLCVNARDAMPNGGKLSITAKNTVLGEEEAKEHPPAKPGKYVAIMAADTGEGIAPQIIERIFDPFFSTKDPSKGTGLGLSTVLGIVRSHGGFITVASKPMQGTTFTVYLPASVDPTPGPSPAAGTLPAGKGELILLADDEEAIRTGTRLILERNGYRVLTANNGADALVMFMQNRDVVRLVVTDMVMPMMGGLALIRALRSIEPGFSVIATAGLHDLATVTELQAAGIDHVVAKPYGPQELLEAVQAELAQDD